MAIYIVKAKKTSLKSPLGINDTSAILKNLVDSHGNAIAMSSFGDWGVMVVKNATKVEMIKFTGVTQNADKSATITFATNGRRILPISPYTGSATGTDPFQTASEVVITNDPLTMASFGNLNNAQTWSLLQTFLVVPKASPAPVAPEDLVNKAYADGLALGGATVDKLVVAGDAGETISAGNLVYFDTTDDEWKKTDADTASTVENVMLGIAQGSGTNGNAITGGVLIRGVDTNQSGRTVGDIQYASNTAGGISNSAGTTSRIIGIAKSATSIYFDPYFRHLVTSSYPTAFTSTSSGASDSGKGSLLNPNGEFSSSFLGGIYGDGSDGSATISSPTTLTRNMYYTDLTVNSTLTTDGYQIFVSGTISGSGTIQWGTPNNGATPANPTNSTAIAGGAGGAQGGSGFLKNVAGAQGGTATNGGVVGYGQSTATAQSPCIGSVGAVGGTGGNGQDGTPVAPTAGSATYTRKFGVMRDEVFLLVSPNSSGVLVLPIPQGQSTGGSSGGGDGSFTGTGCAGSGGGAGASGGIVFISARIWAGTFTIKSIGGNGGNGANAHSSVNANVGGGAGGAGGNGGVSIVIYGTKTWSGSYNLAGGTGGTGGTGAGGGSSGSSGATGTTGTSYEIR